MPTLPFRWSDLTIETPEALSGKSPHLRDALTQLARRGEGCAACDARPPPRGADLSGRRIACAVDPSAAARRDAVLVLEVTFEDSAPTVIGPWWGGSVLQMTSTSTPKDVRILAGHFDGSTQAMVVESGPGWFAHLEARPLCVERRVILPPIQPGWEWRARLGPRPTGTEPVEALCSHRLLPGAPPRVRVPTALGDDVQLSLEAFTGEAALEPAAALEWAWSAADGALPQPIEPLVRRVAAVRWRVHELYAGAAEERCPLLDLEAATAAALVGTWSDGEPDDDGATSTPTCTWTVDTGNGFPLPATVRFSRPGTRDTWTQEYRVVGQDLTGFVPLDQRFVDVVFPGWSFCERHDQTTPCDAPGDRVTHVRIRTPEGRAFDVPVRPDGTARVPVPGFVGDEEFSSRLVGDRWYASRQGVAPNGQLAIEPPETSAQKVEVALGATFGGDLPAQPAKADVKTRGFERGEQVLFNSPYAATSLSAAWRLHPLDAETEPPVALWFEPRLGFVLGQKQYLPLVAPGATYGVDTRRKLAYARWALGTGLVVAFEQGLIGNRAEAALAAGVSVLIGYPVIATDAAELSEVEWSAAADAELRIRFQGGGPATKSVLPSGRWYLVIPSARLYLDDRVWWYVTDGRGEVEAVPIQGRLLQLGGGARVAF